MHELFFQALLYVPRKQFNIHTRVIEWIKAVSQRSSAPIERISIVVPSHLELDHDVCDSTGDLREPQRRDRSPHGERDFYGLSDLRLGDRFGWFVQDFIR